MAYLELILRSVTRWGLLRAVLHFLFVYEYDGVRVVDVLLMRLEGNSQLSLVSLALMETLIDLNCEDVMIDLVFKHLIHGHHLLANYRHKIADSDQYRDAAVTFLGLSPRCCARPVDKTLQWCDELALSGRRVLDFAPERRINGVHDEFAMSNLVHDTKLNYGNPNETLYGNYHAYVCDSRFEVVSRVLACANWTSKYDTVTQKREPNNNTKETKEIADSQAHMKEQDSLISCTNTYEAKTSDSSENQPHSLTSLNEQDEVKNERLNEILNEGKEHDSLTSLGESSGYESFKYKEGDDSEGFAEELFRRSFGKREVREYNGEPQTKNLRGSGELVIGPLLNTLLKKISNLLESEVVVNCRVTSVISKLSSLPAPLLTSLLLCPTAGLQPSVPCLFQILSKLKEEVDELTEGMDNSEELVDKARVYLIEREMALIKTRGQNNEDTHGRDASPAPKLDDSPFKRVEAKRRSISNSISNMFSRRLSSSSPSQTNAISLQNTASPSPQKRPIFTQESYWNQSITLRSILNAVILDEWLKELAALCEEHALRLSAESYEDESYMQSVAL